MEAAHRHPGGEPAHLGLPVAEQRGRADHERRPGRARLPAVEVERDEGERLAEAHVVGQHGPEPERGQLGQPRQAVALVAPQLGPQPRRRVDGLALGGGADPLAHPLQRRADDHLLLDGAGAVARVDLHDAGERGGQRLGRADRAQQALAGAARDGRVDDDPLAAQPEHRRGRGRELLHLLLRERVAVEGDLPAEGEERVGREQPRLQGLLPLGPGGGLPPVLRVAGVRRVEHGPGRQVPSERSRPEHVDPARPQRLDPVLEQVADLVAVELDLVGHGQLEEPVEHRPRLRRRPQRDHGVGARPAAEAVPRPASLRVVRLARVRPQVHRVGDVGGVALVVDLEHEPHGPGGQLPLVGLHAQREGHEVGQVGVGGGAGRAAAVPLEAGAEPVAVRRPGRRGRTRPAPGPLARRGGPRGRGGARHAVDDGLQEAAHDPLGRGGVEVPPGPGRGEHPDPVLVVGGQRAEPPARAAAVGARLEAAGGHEPHRRAAPRRRAGRRSGGGRRAGGPWPARAGRRGPAG